MKMEFGEDAENAEPNEEAGLAARLSKKTKTQAKGENGCFNNDSDTLTSFELILEYCFD